MNSYLTCLITWLVNFPTLEYLLWL
jgi:hypothetical protein